VIDMPPFGKGRRLSPDERQRLEHLFRKEPALTNAAIAARLGCSASYVSRRRRLWKTNLVNLLDKDKE